MIWWCLLLYGLRLEARFDGEGRCVVFLVLFCVGLRSVCPVLFVLCALCFAEKGARFGAGLGVWWRKEARGDRLFAVLSVLCGAGLSENEAISVCRCL